MLRPVLHLLLILALVFNGGAVPWAMAAGHPGSQRLLMAHSDGAAATEAAASDAQHAGHCEAMSGADHTGKADHSKEGSCCHSGACGCGCALPPIVLIAHLPLNPQVLAAAPAAVAARALIVRGGNPPFRPPAV